MMRVKIRLDFKGTAKSSYFFLGGKSAEKIAQEIRDQQIALFKNIPIQGIEIEDITATPDIYLITDSIHNEEIAYAPIELLVRAETLEDIIRFVMKEEFRKIEVLEPQEIVLGKQEMERIFVKINSELKAFIPNLLRKLER